MAQSRELTLVQEKCRDQATKEIIASKNKEIEELRQLVENNPLLAERHAKVVDLEL
jgi:hypothetical protein